MSYLKSYIFLLLLFTTAINASTIKIIPPQSKYDASHNYFETLLNRIFEITNDKYEKNKIIYSVRMQQGRAFIELKKGKNLDIYWAGTSPLREKEFNAVKIPLIKGLLGYRAFIINKNEKELFDNINSIEDLKNLKACQGTHWPDTKILENSDLKVVKNTNYELMFLQVQTNRCDYFPRGVHEIVSEVNIRKEKYPDLMIYDDLMIYYPFPMYFFVSKNNHGLAKRIEEGLLLLIENAQFDSFIKNHEVTKHLFPISSWINKKTFKLQNPFLSKETDYNNKKFWIVKENE